MIEVGVTDADTVTDERRRAGKSRRGGGKSRANGRARRLVRRVIRGKGRNSEPLLQKSPVKDTSLSFVGAIARKAVNSTSFGCPKKYRTELPPIPIERAPLATRARILTENFTEVRILRFSGLLREVGSPALLLHSARSRGCPTTPRSGGFGRRSTSSASRRRSPRPIAPRRARPHHQVRRCGRRHPERRHSQEPV